LVVSCFGTVLVYSFGIGFPNYYLLCSLKNKNLNLFIQVISGINTGLNCGYEMYALISEMVYLLSIFYFIIDSFQNSIGSILLPLLLQGKP